MKIKISEILVDNDFNCRGDDLSLASVQDLAEQIAQVGLLHPIVVCPLADSEKKYFPTYNYRLIIGFRRTLAHRFLNYEEIEASILSDVSTDQQMIMNLSENLQRENLSPLQEARTIERFTKKGMTVDYIARKLGQPRGWVDQRIALLQLPAEVQMMFNSKSIPMSKIRDLVHIQEYRGDFEVKKAAATMRDLHTAGHSIGNLQSRKKNAESKRQRSRGELFELQARIRKANGGEPNILVRLLGFAAGEVVLSQIEEDLVKEFPEFK